ncbi:MAG: undecaprenyl-diphosphatase [Bacillota bacterium]|nr:undecaprenyl-diphosphatase [Bacillota bacterium]
MDYHIFQTINHLAVSDSFLNPLMKFLSQDAEYLFFLGILIYWFIRTTSNRRMVAEGLISACIALGLNAFIGLLFYRDRPFVHHHVIKLISHVANASFPSDHATGAFVIATSILIWRKRDGWIWLILAAAIAFSRVWTGVHYPSDVLAGMFIGFIIAPLVHGLLKAWKFADNLLNSIVGFYERLEGKVWKGKDVSNF